MLFSMSFLKCKKQQIVVASFAANNSALLSLKILIWKIQ